MHASAVRLRLARATSTLPAENPLEPRSATFAGGHPLTPTRARRGLRRRFRNGRPDVGSLDLRAPGVFGGVVLDAAVSPSRGEQSLHPLHRRPEEHPSELQSHSFTSYP